jgi:potassium efflux system protein
MIFGGHNPAPEKRGANSAGCGGPLQPLYGLPSIFLIVMAYVSPCRINRRNSLGLGGNLPRKNEEGAPYSMTMGLKRNLLLVVACLALALAAAQPTGAQESGPEAPQPLAPPTSEAIAAFSKALDEWAAEIAAQEQAIAGATTTDDELRAIPDRLEALREAILEKKALLKPKLQETRERLAKLGPPPAEGAPPESSEITEQRKELEAEVATIDGKLKQADVLYLRAEQLIDAANDKRHERFTESLFRPIPNFYSAVLPSAFEQTPAQIEKVLGALADWCASAWSKGVVFLLLLLLAPIGAGFAMWRFLERIEAHHLPRRMTEKIDEPTLQDCGTAALKNSFWACLPLWTGLAGFYLINTAAGLADPTLDGFLLKAVLAAVWASLLAALVRYSLVPEDEAWKVIPSTDGVAWRVASLLWAIIGVWFVDQLLVLTDTVVFTPYQFSVLRSGWFAGLYGILIALTLFMIQSGPVMRKATFTGWRGWLFSFAGVVAGLILIATLLGYESLARFIGAHAVSTAGVLWIMYLFHLAAESISSVSVISGGPIDDDLDEDQEMGAPSLLTIRIIVSLLLDIAILAVGITILLLLWRFDWVEVKGWIQAAFFGFQFGNLHLSLESLLIALGVFMLGLALTRFVQRWLMGRVFTGRRADSGLHESVRIGIGYLGFVLAALAGISYLGVDFSNLAIIAGALSVGIGFGLQSIFNNFVSGLILLAERPIKIGDYIQVGGQEGTVKKISVRSTEIETIHRQSVIIPNATLIIDPVSNWMHLDKSCRLDIPVGVDYKTDVELLRSTLLSIAQAYRGVLKSPPPVVHFAGFGDSSLDFELRVFLRDVRDRIKSSSDLRFAVLAALRNAGISIPFPQRDVHLKDGKGAARPRRARA